MKLFVFGLFFALIFLSPSHAQMVANAPAVLLAIPALLLVIGITGWVWIKIPD